MRLLLTHFSAGTPGGVDLILAQHARLFAARGHDVTIASSSQHNGRKSKNFVHVPKLSVRAARELDSGKPGPAFGQEQKAIQDLFRPLIAGFDIVFLHNIFTMPFHLAWTAAMWQLATVPRRGRFVAWVHDLAACNPDYNFPHLSLKPWKLLASAHPRVEYVAISELRKREFVSLTRLKPHRCRVIPNGVDANELLRLSPRVARFVKGHGLLQKQLVLLHPARLVRRKNVELGLQVVEHLKTRGVDCCYLVTGAPDRHNSASAIYAEELVHLRDKLGLTRDAFFLHESFPVTRRTLLSLYAVSDALFFPSKQEGFGIPPLEAAFLRLPVFCSDREPMNALIPDHFHFFDPAAAPAAIAKLVLETISRDNASLARKKTLRDFEWQTIFTRHLEPLLRNKN
ncbi:MAG: hypothetical protein QOD99_469 [Chthoniobacter sp.]|jgi:glycosyltransferase involved in cell wall biosynthesis|nr:hypothetical protein [Chthoniobacter sp.]